jgi:hypothetical protein
MACDVVAVKVKPGELYTALRKRGFQSGAVLGCSKCQCRYRIFYPPASPTNPAAADSFFRRLVEKSHPAHVDLLQMEPT